jgi:hypothetical protein
VRVPRVRESARGKWWRVLIGQLGKRNDPDGYRIELIER